MANQSVVGYYNNENEAIEAIEDLKRQGYRPEDISVLSKDKDETETVAEETGTHAGEGAATGAVTGGALGGLGGVLAGIGALAIPGIGPIVAAGPVVAGLTGAAAGAGVGGLAGALIGMGVPEEEAKEYETRFNEGKILVLIDEENRPLSEVKDRDDVTYTSESGLRGSDTQVNDTNRSRVDASDPVIGAQHDDAKNKIDRSGL